MIDPGGQLVFEIVDSFKAVVAFVETEKSHDGVGFDNRQPFVRHRVVSLAVVSFDLRAEFFRTGKRPRIRLASLGAQRRSVAGKTHVAEGKFFVRKARIEQRFEMTEVLHALGQAVTDEDDLLTLLRRERQSRCLLWLTTDIFRLLKFGSLASLLLLLRGGGDVFFFCWSCSSLLAFRLRCFSLQKRLHLGAGLR